MFFIKAVSPESTPGNTVYSRRTHTRGTKAYALDHAYVVATQGYPADVFEGDVKIARVHSDGGIDFVGA